LPAEVVWRDKPRSDIPGSLWLPDTGYGELAPVMLDYFRRGLDKALGGRPRPLVFYCLADCWMSWNAAKRALALGYTNVAWYPGGSDGWAAAGLPIEKRTPEPRP
jgi:PQQ-dependent catabolism-associated CXXCW motif protein